MTIAETEATIRARLLSEGMRTVLTGAMQASTGTNPIRGNLFAAAMRELITAYLHELAPNESVRACPWYEDETGDGRPTRAQRQRYITQGGLSDHFVENTLNLDVGALREQLRDSFEDLNRATHLREDTIVGTDDAVSKLVEESLDALAAIMDAVDHCRHELMHSISAAASSDATEEILKTAIAEIDEKAGHHVIEHIWIEEVTTVGIDAKHVSYKVRGSIDAELQYGSGSDFRRGDAATIDHNFPFTYLTVAPVSDPLTFDKEQSELQVEDGGWYD
jgi:hypothetical protein